MSSLIRRVIERAGQFVYSVRDAVFRRDGRTLTSAEVLAKVDQRIADAKGLMRDLTGSIARGEISVAQWRDAMALEIRRSTFQIHALGRGGWDNINADKAAIAERLKAEYGYLDKFAADIQAGNLSQAQIQMRADMYADHTRASYWEGAEEANREAGRQQERRVMGLAEHCIDCEGYASEGWQPLGYFPPPGDGSVCRANCQCSMEFR